MLPSLLLKRGENSEGKVTCHNYSLNHPIARMSGEKITEYFLFSSPDKAREHDSEYNFKILFYWLLSRIRKQNLSPDV